jgi:hypothetical protein
VNLHEVNIQTVRPIEEKRFQELMQMHHYLGALPKISETLWYVATLAGQWVALLSFSDPTLKCSPRDRWIGWDFRHQYDRLKLLTNNSRFLILPDWHIPNLGSRILSLCQQRLPLDWRKHFGHPLVLLETFVDPQRFQGTIYKAANMKLLPMFTSFVKDATKAVKRISQSESKEVADETLTELLGIPTLIVKMYALRRQGENEVLHLWCAHREDVSLCTHCGSLATKIHQEDVPSKNQTRYGSTFRRVFFFRLMVK